MKQLDELLRDSRAVQPQRSLRTDFTQSVIQGIETAPQAQGWWHVVREMYKKLNQRPIMALGALAVVTAIGGTTYAALNWAQTSALFGGAEILKNGNRVVTVNVSNCSFDTQNHQAQTKVYYEVKKGSALSDRQVVSMVQGVCENNVVTSVSGPVMKDLAQRYGNRGLEGLTTYRITAVESGKLVMKLDRQYGRGELERTFIHIASGVKVYNGTEVSDYQSLKPGDTVSIATWSSVNLEQVDPDRNNTSLQTVVAIVKHPAYTGEAGLFYEHLGKDFVRTQPCTTDASGYCRVYDFD